MDKSKTGSVEKITTSPAKPSPVKSEKVKVKQNFINPSPVQSKKSKASVVDKKPVDVVTSG